MNPDSTPSSLDTPPFCADLEVMPIPAARAADIVIEHHYLHRRPPISESFGLLHEFDIVGVCTFGVPASRHAQMSVCPTDPSLALELNRLWIHDDQRTNTASWFIARCLRRLPPRIVFSYADTAHGHTGIVYRAANFTYAGVTDADRKTPRFDYVLSSGKHSRDWVRSDDEYERVRRQPKHRYWTTTGTPAQRRALRSMCGWATIEGGK